MNELNPRLKEILLPLLIAAALLTTAVAGLGSSRAAFSSTTSSTADVQAGALTGLDAPRIGVTSFGAAPTSAGCDLSWSGLAGGTNVADRFEVTDESGGTALFATSAGDVSAGSFGSTPTAAVSTYRLRTRAASTWVSPQAETRVATCVRPGQIAVDAGDTATCGIRTDETLWCWGFGQRLTPGDNEFLTTTAPRLESAASWRQVSVSIGHACGLHTNATLWCWGDNWTGQLGTGTTDDELDPIQVGPHADWIMVQTLGYTTCGIRAPGTLWCWGRNDLGQAGDGTGLANYSPVQIGTGTDWTVVTGGPRHACGVRGGDLWCWGQNLDGELGDGTGSMQLSPVQAGDPGVWSSSISLGEQHSCAIRLDASLWCWGTNWFGERGSTASSQQFTPAQVGSTNDWAQLSAGRYFTCATKIDGTLWCTGTNLQGVTGQNVTSGTTELFTQVGTESTWALVALGSKQACAVRVDQSLWCWGSNNVGQVGQPETSWLAPVAVNAETDWSEVQAGYNHTCARKADQTLWCFGENSSAQLGLGNRNDGYFEPTQVAGGGQWIAFETGDFHSCGIKLGGTLWCWGRNSSGQLGSGGNDASTVPLQVGTDSDWGALGTGRQHNCAIKINGTLWCWGANHAGTVGDGTTTQAPSPVQIGTATNWWSIDAGFRHTCAVRTDRTLWCWGANGNGQVGDGTWTDRLVPTQIGTDADWISVGAGRDHSCAVKFSGTMWCWGRGSEGQLGDGAITSQGAPVQVGTGTSWSSVDGGHNYSCGRQSDNSLWCWGRNGAGNFGNGAVGGIASTPSQYHTGFSDFAVSTGHWHTCGLTPGGSLQCWGANYSGQLGYTNPVSLPAEVTGSYTWTP